MKRISLIAGCLFALLAASCNKELSDDFNRYADSPLNDTAWARSLVSAAAVNDLFDALAPVVITDSFSLDRGATLRYGDSMELEIKANSCGINGSGVAQQGQAKIEIVPLKRKGDFIKFFRPTTTDNGSLLVSGGGVFLRITKDDKELALVQGNTLKVKFSDIDSAKFTMQAFYGKESNPTPSKGIDTSFSWIRDLDTTALATWNKISTNPLVPSYYGYEINSKNLRWIAAERYADSTAGKVKVTAILSPNFTNKNTAVFLVFDKQKTVAGMRPDYASRSFYANNIPLGASVKLVSISKIGGDYYLGVENITSVALVTRYTVKPDKKSLKEVITFLNGL